MFLKEKHYCKNPSSFPLGKYHQIGIGKGKKLLLVGESPAANGWRKSGKACYSIDGKILPSGKRLNELLDHLGLSVEKCGFTELAKCFVGKNRNSLFSCSKGCWPIFVKQLESVNYQLIIILGVATLNIFNRLSGLHLKTGQLSDAKINGKKYAVLPIYHPSPINPYSRKKNTLIIKSLKEKLLNLT
jgi:uracil-DNA glycosylase family 4